MPSPQMSFHYFIQEIPEPFIKTLPRFRPAISPRNFQHHFQRNCRDFSRRSHQNFVQKLLMAFRDLGFFHEILTLSLFSRKFSLSFSRLLPEKSPKISSAFQVFFFRISLESLIVISLSNFLNIFSDYQYCHKQLTDNFFEKLLYELSEKIHRD